MRRASRHSVPRTAFCDSANAARSRKAVGRTEPFGSGCIPRISRFVIPAKAGIQGLRFRPSTSMDSRLRGNDDDEVCCGTAFRRGRQTASDSDVNVKSRSRIGGIIIVNGDSSPLTRIGLPNSSMLLSMITGDSLKRKFFTGCRISPFSM